MADAMIDESALDELRQIMGDDFSLLVDTFVSDSQRRIDDMQQALVARSSDILRGAAHGLKGSAMNFAATRLTQLCQQLEHCGRYQQLDDAPAILKKVQVEFDLLVAYLRP